MPVKNNKKTQKKRKKKNPREDFYTRKAREEGYPARSVYKLKEIDDKYLLFKEGDRVLDLGCAPGSWLLYISEKVGDSGMVTGIDTQGINIHLKNNIQFFKADIFDLSEIKFLMDYYNVIVSDLAPATSGMRDTDAARSLELCEKVFEIAQSHLRRGGTMMCKIFESDLSEDFLKIMKLHFGFVKKCYPMAIRKGSREMYIIGKRYKA